MFSISSLANEDQRSTPGRPPPARLAHDPCKLRGLPGLGTTFVYRYLRYHANMLMLFRNHASRFGVLVPQPATAASYLWMAYT